jgi:hypothetical protein
MGQADGMGFKPNLQTEPAVRYLSPARRGLHLGLYDHTYVTHDEGFIFCRRWDARHRKHFSVNEQKFALRVVEIYRLVWWKVFEFWEKEAI